MCFKIALLSENPFSNVGNHFKSMAKWALLRIRPKLLPVSSAGIAIKKSGDQEQSKI